MHTTAHRSARPGARLLTLALVVLSLSSLTPASHAAAAEVIGSDYYSNNALNVTTVYGFRRNACTNGGHGYQLQSVKGKFVRADSQHTARFNSGRAGVVNVFDCYSGSPVNKSTTITKSTAGMTSGTTYSWTLSSYPYVEALTQFSSVGTWMKADLYRSGVKRFTLCGTAYVVQDGDPC